MDLAGAVKAGIKLNKNQNELFKKAHWTYQIKGVYNLLFDSIHDDFPTRRETEFYVNERIVAAFMAHNGAFRHNGAFSYNVIEPPFPITQINRSVMEKFYLKNYFTNNGMSLFDISVKIDPNFEDIGYGI